jgi:uncharacterized protein (TIGR03437 family)
MLNRNVSLALCLGVLAGAAFAQSSNQGTGYVFEFATTTAASGQFQPFIYNTALGTPPTYTGPAGANQVIPKPDGSKFYVIGSGGVDDFNATFATPATLNGITGTPTQGVISPDGRFLLIASILGSGSGSVYVLNTLTDAVVMTQPISGTVISVVVSRDSKTAWILATESGQAVIVVVNLTTQQQIGSPVFLRDPVTDNSLAGNPQSMTMSPLGLLYVSAGNEIDEINPPTLAAAALNGGSFPSTGLSTPVKIGVNATAGPLQFSTDGTTAYFINLTPNSGNSLLAMSLPSHSVVTWPPFVAGHTPEAFDSILVAGGNSTGSPTRLFAHSAADTTLWDVSPDLSTPLASCNQIVCPSAVLSSSLDTSVLSMVLSNELPSARFLFVLIGGGSQASIYRVDLSTNSVTSQASAALGSGTLQFAIVPPETNPTGFIQFNSLQPNLAAGATALPLIARVLDPAGRPIYNLPVTFTGDPSLVFTNVSAATNADGYAQATVTLGQTPGAFPVTLTAGSATITFSLTIPGGPIQPGNGPNQMTIISGNGQLIQANFGHAVPLTVQLLDTNGNPLVNQPVAFTIVGNTSIGVLDTLTTNTDTNGIAFTDFFPQSIGQNVGFQGTTVTAVATQGSVTFNETVWQADDPTKPVSVTILQPASQSIGTVGEGDVVPGAIVATVSLHAFGTSSQIPNVAINILTDDGQGNPGPGYCKGNPLTDATGTVSCDFVPVCSTATDASTMAPWGLGLHFFAIDLGGANTHTDYSVNVTGGSTRTLSIPTSNSGNNQSGRPGAALTLPLTAVVTDQCGSSVQGAPVTWRVTQGTATISNTTTVSNQGGTVQTHVTLGQTPGTVTIVASLNATTQVTFTETITAVVGNLKLVSGGGQVVLLNQAFSPIVFQITDTSNNPVPGLLVSFAVASGSASLGTPSTQTNAQGQVSVNVTAGNVAGPVTITATYGTFTASASLTVTAPGPGVTISSFVNAASGQVGLTPCGLALVTGSGLAPGISGVVLGGNPLGIGPLPYTLSGVSITINGTPAPLQAVSNQNGTQQVNFQTPCELVTGSPATVVVTVGSVTTQVTGVTVYPAQPGIFTYPGTNGTNYGYVVDSNGNTLTPSNLAHAGQTYYLITTGLGQTTPPALTNAVGTAGETIPIQNIILAINNIGVPVTSVQYQQGSRGLYVITFQVPAVANGAPFPTGTNLPVSLGVTVNSQTFFDNSPVALPGIQ